MNFKHFSIFVLSFLLVCCSTLEQEIDEEPQVSTSKVLVYDNFDSDYKNPPFEDRLTIMNSEGIVEKTITGFNNCQNIGGNRVLSVSEDGQTFVLCEIVWSDSDQKISKYDISGNLILNIPGDYTSVSMSGNFIYTVCSHTIFAWWMYKIDASGYVVAQKKVGQFDHVVDPDRSVIWTVGAEIIKADLDLNELMRADPIGWSAVSVDYNPDGSIWVAERKHIQVLESRSRLLKISPTMETLQIIDFDWNPKCVRVNRANGDLWTTGEFGLKKFDSQGNEIFTIPGFWGYTLAIDPFDNSVWIGAYEDVRHYSSAGLLLGQYTDGFSTYDQKWIAIAPAN